MISRIHGKVMSWDADAQSVEVDVNGLCYEVLLPTYCWRALEHRPAELSLFTYYHVPERQPTPVLIGFLRQTEREFFKKFMKVRGMGPTKAQRALAASVSTIAHWIESENRAALKGLPGVGTRQADQIIAELRGKVVEEAMLQDERYREAEEVVVTLDRAAKDAVEALVNLGYQRREAETWVADVVGQAEDATTEVILRAVFERVAADQ